MKSISLYTETQILYQYLHDCYSIVSLHIIIQSHICNFSDASNPKQKHVELNQSSNKLTLHYAQSINTLIKCATTEEKPIKVIHSIKI